MTGDDLLPLLGKQASDPALARLLDGPRVQWRPQVSDLRTNDWVAVANTELGFEDVGYFNATEGKQADSAPVLQQVSIYAPNRGPSRDATITLPEGLDFAQKRDQVRSQLAPKASAARLRRRDVFEIGGVTYVVTYDQVSSIDSLLMSVERASRRNRANPPLGFSELRGFMGLRWYSPVLRSRLYGLAASAGSVAQIKDHGTCNLIREAGLRLLFKRGNITWSLAGCEIYRHRVLDAADWQGDLPGGLIFSDTARNISAKLCTTPKLWQEHEFDAVASWTVGGATVTVTFDTIVNLISSVRFELIGDGSP